MADVIVPEVGESITEGLLVEWSAEDGAYIAADEPLFVLETDKITMNVETEVGGALKVLVQAGETVKIGQKVAEIDTSAAAPAKPAAKEAAPANVEAAEPAAEPTPEPAPKTAASSATASSATASSATASSAAAPPVDDGPPRETPAGMPQARAKLDAGIDLSPAVRRMVEENKLDPATITGTGKDGRIIKADVLRAMEGGVPAEEAAPEAAPATPSPATTAANAPASPAAPPAKAQPTKPAPAATVDSKAPHTPGARETRVKMTPMRQRIAERLIQAQQGAAILTTFNEVDLSRVMEMRSRVQAAFQAKHGVKLGFMSFFTKAAVNALKEVPQVNARIEGDEIVYNHYFDIGVAVGTEQGLVVPVIRDTDQLSYAGIEMAVAALAEKAHKRSLALSDLTGGVFTISNGGIYGNMLSTPIINPPQSGILGMHAIKKRTVVIDDAIAIRPMMYVAMSYDHRIVDGREAVTFLKRIVNDIENPQEEMLEL